MALLSLLNLRRISLRWKIPALGLAIGVFVGQMLVWLVATRWCVGLLVGCGTLFVLFPKRVRCSLVGISLGVATGLLGVALHPSEWSARDAQVLVRIVERPSRRLSGEVTFIGREVLGRGQRTIRCRSVDLPWRNASDLERGDVVWVRGEISPIVRPRNPFSWEGFLWRQGVSGEMKALFVSRPVMREESLVDGVRREIRSLVSQVTDDGRGGALFLSMALGERDVLSVHVENAFKGVGLSHLLVVSGYQVSLIFGVVFAGFMQVRSLFGAHIYLRTIATCGALVCCFGYVVLVGAEMSSVRALVAAACLCVALVIDRAHRFSQRWATALLVMQVMYPWAACEVGVILTFAALAGIGLGSVLGGRNPLASCLWVTVCAWLLTSTVTLVWNGSISVVGILLNLLLATSWSIWNCAVGGVALGLATLPSWFAGAPLRVVAWGNEVVVGAILWGGGSATKQEPIEGLRKWILVSALLCSILWVVRGATKRSYAMSMRSMITPRYRRS